MTELTDEAVKALLAHYDLPTDCDCNDDDCVKCSHYPTFQERASKQLKDAAPDLARALLDARAENARLRADAQAAVALVVERAVRGVSDLTHWTGDDDHGTTLVALQEAITAIRALAPADGLAFLAVQANAGGPVILEDTTETVAPDRDRNGWILPVLLGVLAIGLIANGGGDGVSVGDPVGPGPKPCVKTEGAC